jgi:acetyl-CoA carboxylase carboxyl transferase subunit beta
VVPNLRPSDDSQFDEADALFGAIGLSCPSCDTELSNEPSFERMRVCPACKRHFGLPARERISLLVKPSEFSETSGELVSLDPVRFHDHLPAADRLAGAQERSLISSAVITGVARISGNDAVLIVLDAAYIGGAIGILAGEKLALALDLAWMRRLPVIVIAAGGGVRTQDGMLAVLQMAKTATLAARLHRHGIPIISVLTHPTSGGIYAGLALQADFILAEPGANASGESAAEQGLGGPLPTSEQLLAAGAIDGIVSRDHLRETLASLLHLLNMRGSLHVPAHTPTATGAALPGWDALRIGRHPDRPTAARIALKLLTNVQQVHGDRMGHDDPALIGGIGRFEGLTVAFLAHNRRPDGETDVLLTAAAYRKAARIMQLAGRLELPLIAFVDTGGAATGLQAELSGVSSALAQNLQLMGHLPAPVITVITGEAGGAGALANALGDRILVAEHGIFTLPVVEGALASPFFLRQTPTDTAASEQRKFRSLGARDAMALGVIDRVIPEPEGGAHLDPDAAMESMRVVIAESLGEVLTGSSRRLLGDRIERARQIGLADPEGSDIASRELRELTAIQHAVSRSIDDFRQDVRDRFEHRKQSLPQLTNKLPKRPDLNDLAGRISQFRESVSTAANQARQDLVEEWREIKREDDDA